MNARRHSCEELAVCQDRKPPCRNCQPVSEGTRTARLLLDNMPPIERPPFYIFPRTLEEAFGPHQRDLVTTDQPTHPADKIVLRASCVALVVLVAAGLMGVLPS